MNPKIRELTAAEMELISGAVVKPILAEAFKAAMTYLVNEVMPAIAKPIDWQHYQG
jgi:hypothetical protein